MSMNKKQKRNQNVGNIQHIMKKLHIFNLLLYLLIQ